MTLQMLYRLKNTKEKKGTNEQKNERTNLVTTSLLELLIAAIKGDVRKKPVTDSVSDPECKFKKCDQPPGDIDLVMAIKVQLLIIPMDHTPPMFVTV